MRMHLTPYNYDPKLRSYFCDVFRPHHFHLFVKTKLSLKRPNFIGTRARCARSGENGEG